MPRIPQLDLLAAPSTDDLLAVYDNTGDATGKATIGSLPVSSVAQTALDAKVDETNPVLNGTVTGTAFLDEDAMTSNSATKIPSQQSVKAYVDGNISPGAIPVKLANLEYTNASVINAGTGDIDIYTVPVGKQAIITSFVAYNSSVGSITWTPELYISAAYYKITASTTTNTITAVANNASRFRIVLNAGEKFAVLTTGTGMSFWANVQVWDANANVKRATLLSLANGDNTLLTVPSGKRVILTGSNGIQQPTTVTGEAQYFNGSGGARTVNWYLAPNGSAVGSTTRVTTSASVADGAVQTYAGPGVLNAGDVLAIATNANTATQIAIASYLEYDV